MMVKYRIHIDNYYSIKLIFIKYGFFYFFILNLIYFLQIIRKRIYLEEIKEFLEYDCLSFFQYFFFWGKLI